MLTFREVERLLTRQSQAYALLMWLADASARDPGVLSPAAVTALRMPETAGPWLERHRAQFPADLLPTDPGGTFASLLSSFFSTSFHVTHLELEGRLLESRVTVGGPQEKGAISGLEHCQLLALRHLAASAKVPLSEKDARQLVRRQGLYEASLLWTYVWELDRRAKEKGKGSVVHRLWRSIPRDTRKILNADQVWQGRELLLNAARELSGLLTP